MWPGEGCVGKGVWLSGRGYGQGEGFGSGEREYGQGGYGQEGVKVCGDTHMNATGFQVVSFTGMAGNRDHQLYL